MSNWSRAVVVGASSGIGEEIAYQLAAEGTRLVLVARREDRLAEIGARIRDRFHGSEPEIVVCDVRDVAAGQSAFGKIVESDPIDLIIYSSGVMPQGASEGFPTDEDVKAIETNFTGAVVWLNAAATYFQKRGAGTIVGIGSVAGDRGRQGNPVYNSTKAALATYLEALRNRLTRYGVVVVTTKPGFVRTPMLHDRSVFPPAAPVEDAARHIIAAAKRGRRVAYIPPWWRLVAWFLKLIPAPLMERLPV